TEQASAEEARRQSAEQAAAEKSGARRCLAETGRGVRLRDRALDRRRRIRRGTRGRRRRKGAEAAAAAGEASAGTRMGIVRNKHERGCDRSKRDQPAMTNHGLYLPADGKQRVCVRAPFCKGLGAAAAKALRDKSRNCHGDLDDTPKRRLRRSARHRFLHFGDQLLERERLGEERVLLLARQV